MVARQDDMEGRKAARRGVESGAGAGRANRKGSRKTRPGGRGAAHWGGRPTRRGEGTRARGRKAPNGKPTAACDCGCAAAPHKVWCATRRASREHKAALDREAAAARPAASKQREQREREILRKKKDSAAWFYARRAAMYMAIAHHKQKKAAAGSS